MLSISGLSMEPAACVVMSNDDLLIQILLRLPATSLCLFKYVSKRWLSLITDASFTRRRRQFPSPNLVDPPWGLFIARPESRNYEYDLVPVDTRFPVKRRSAVFNFGSEEASALLQSCNGLLLCADATKPLNKYYVCNPTINVLKMLPECHDVNSDLGICSLGTRIAFDPTKSPYYKVVAAISTDPLHIQMQTYSSQTCNWTVTVSRAEFDLGIYGFCDGIYWNEAIHWLNIEFRRPTHFMLDIADHSKIIKIQKPNIMTDEVFDRELLVSGGCLLLSFRNKTQPQLSYVCETRNRYSGWSVKYIVNLNDIMNPFSETGMAHLSVWGIVLGAKEEDSFIVMEVCGKVVQYNFTSKAVHTLIGSVRPFRYSVHQFIASFASV